jgi:hypothetical protein
MPRKKQSRNMLRLMRYGEIVEQQKPQNRVEYEKLIDNRRKEVEEVLIERNKDFRKFNIKAKACDLKKDKQCVRNKTFNDLKQGFSSTPNKENYIKANKDHIKALPVNEQRNLIQYFLRYL